ncbi:MAG: HAD-IIIC family phosphatase [Actinomycetota bacterium]
MRRWRELGEEPTGRSVLLAASFTANPIVPSLGAAIAADEGDAPVISVADYNQIFQLCLDPAAAGAVPGGDIVVVWRIEDVFERDLLAWAEDDADGEVTGRLIDGVRSFAEALAGLADRHDGSIVVSDAPTPIGFGLDHRDPSELDRLDRLRRMLANVVDDVLVDTTIDRLRLGALQQARGTLAAFDRRNWVMHRNPCSNDFAHDIGTAIADLLRARTSVPPKVLVLDCDDTIWAGTLVDDGIGALQCGDAFPGFAFRSFQYAARRLRHRGVLLALASKNDDEAVRVAFGQVDGMVLSDDDIAGRRVSWEPKPHGIAALATEFNLGLDSFVFVDDSDFEVGSARTQLPMVRTLQVPDDVEELPDLLAESGWFRLMNVTDDDRERTARMIAESGRAAAATEMSQADFLAALGLTVRVVEVGEAQLGRVTQLINKTNQFNLTTVRRGEAEVAALVADPDVVVCAASVDDRYGEYGIVGVVIARTAADDPAVAWDLDTVLMSCRVLGRGVESAMLRAAVDLARRRRSGAVRGRYVATDRNAMVADLLERHRFVPGDERDGEPSVVLPGGVDVPVPDHVTLVAPGRD